MVAANAAQSSREREAATERDEFWRVRHLDIPLVVRESRGCLSRFRSRCYREGLRASTDHTEPNTTTLIPGFLPVTSAEGRLLHAREEPEITGYSLLRTTVGTNWRDGACMAQMVTRDLKEH